MNTERYNERRCLAGIGSSARAIDATGAKKLGRFLDDKSQEAFDAINSLIEERLQGD